MGDHELPTNPNEPTLSLEEITAFETLIDDSIVAEYNGDLNRWWDERDGGYIYTPLDSDHVRELLVKLWGEILTSEAIDDAFVRLTEDGAREWPRAYCEEDKESSLISDIGPH